MLAAEAWPNTNSRATHSVAPARLKNEVRPVPTAAVYPTWWGCWQQGRQPMFKPVPRVIRAANLRDFPYQYGTLAPHYI